MRPPLKSSNTEGIAYKARAAIVLFDKLGTDASKLALDDEHNRPQRAGMAETSAGPIVADLF